MKDAFNYSGFSSTLVMMRRRRNKSNKRPVVVQSSERDENDINRSVPPYLVDPDKPKSGFKL